MLTPLRERFPATYGKLGLVDGRLHSFRHYFCSEAANSREVSEQMLMAWLGHQDSKMVRHYFHAKADEARRQMEAVNFVKAVNPRGKKAAGLGQGKRPSAKAGHRGRK